MNAEVGRDWVREERNMYGVYAMCLAFYIYRHGVCLGTFPINPLLSWEGPKVRWLQ